MAPTLSPTTRSPTTPTLSPTLAPTITGTWLSDLSPFILFIVIAVTLVLLAYWLSIIHWGSSYAKKFRMKIELVTDGFEDELKNLLKEPENREKLRDFLKEKNIVLAETFKTDLTHTTLSSQLAESINVPIRSHKGVVVVHDIFFRWISGRIFVKLSILIGDQISNMITIFMGVFSPQIAILYLQVYYPSGVERLPVMYAIFFIVFTIQVLFALTIGRLKLITENELNDTGNELIPYSKDDKEFFKMISKKKN